jgi:hypothetical protein
VVSVRNRKQEEGTTMALTRIPGSIQIIDPMDFPQTLTVSFGDTYDNCEFCDKPLDGKPCMVFVDNLAETACLTCIDSMFESGDLRKG